MLIEIRCGNFSNFDASLGRYVECGETLIVSNDQLGDVINCTKCSQPVEVPYDATTQPQASGASASPEKSARGQQRSETVRKRAKTPQGNVRSKSQSRQPSGDKRKTTPPLNPARRKQKQARPRPTGGKTVDVMSMDLGSQPVESNLNADRKERCKKCGNISHDGKCTVCKFVAPKFEKLYQPLDDIKIELVGFQRWFCQTMNEGVSIQLVEWGAHIMLGLLSVLLLVAAGICFAGFGPGVTGGVILLVFLIPAIALYIGMILKGRQFTKNPNARLAWFQRPFWNLILMLARAQSWEKYDSGLKNRRIVKVREPQFGDIGIADLEGIKNCQVLDLEGTKVTDRGLLDLYDLKHLHCLVLKRTKVTHQGVFRLQQSFPRLWIWY